MKPTSSKDNTLEVLIFIVIIIVAVILTYVAWPVFHDVQHSTVLGRIIAVPMMATVYVISPGLSPGYEVVGCIGSIIFYFWLGTLILIQVQNWIVARRKAKTPGTVII
jgi:hypothetical protein